MFFTTVKKLMTQTHTGILFYTFMSYQFNIDVLLFISVEVFFVWLP
jgi:hypothetical protein